MRPTNTPNATVVPIRDEEAGFSTNQKKEKQPVSSLLHKIGMEDHKKLVHSIKVGIALVLVSLLYLLRSLYDRVGENAMWAIMTVVVVFEFTAGGTLSKGLNRGMGTILGGGLGCLTALAAQKVPVFGRAIVISFSVFIFGAAATYLRLIPSIKKKFDYGALIFILTFNLVAVSGFYGEEIIKLAGERLSTIGMGFAICVFVSLFVFPIWAGDELHRSLVSKFDKLALCIQECMEECFKQSEEKMEPQTKTESKGYKSLLHSKSGDEVLANFARWEPWHGRFGFTYPWNKYLQIGELLRELSASILTMRDCLKSHQQSPSNLKSVVKEPCETICGVVCSKLRELGDDIFNMRRHQQRDMINAKLQSTKLELNSSMSTVFQGALANGNENSGDGLLIASFVFMLMEMVNKVEVLAKEVEELGDVAGFSE